MRPPCSTHGALLSPLPWALHQDMRRHGELGTGFQVLTATRSTSTITTTTSSTVTTTIAIIATSPPPPPPHRYLQRPCSACPACPAPGPQQPHGAGAPPAHTNKTASVLKSCYLLFHTQPPRSGLCPSAGGSRYTQATCCSSSSSSYTGRDVQWSRAFPVK